MGRNCELKKPQDAENITSHPRIAHGQRYPMPCLERSSEEVEGEQGSGPKGPMSCRTQGGISLRPSVLPSVLPRVGHQGLKFALPAPNSALQTSNRPSRLQFSPPGLKSALPTSNLPYRPQICPPDLRLTLQASNQLSVAQICLRNLKFALQALILPSSLQICLNQSSKA